MTSNIYDIKYADIKLNIKAYQDTFSIKKYKLQEPRIYLHYCLYTDKEVPAVTIPLPTYIFHFLLYSVSSFLTYIFYSLAHITERNS